MAFDEVSLRDTVRVDTNDDVVAFLPPDVDVTSFLTPIVAHEDPDEPNPDDDEDDSPNEKLGKYIIHTFGRTEDGKSVLPLLAQGSSAQDEQATLSDANAFIAIPEGDVNIAAGSNVTVVVLERRYI
jgi:hypothetical protein